MEAPELEAPWKRGFLITEQGLSNPSVRIYYEIYCTEARASGDPTSSVDSAGEQQQQPADGHGAASASAATVASASAGAEAAEPVRVLLIMGVAATCHAWHTQVQALLARARALGRPLQACIYDNRGVGRSTAPEERKHYGSLTMARDAGALLEHLGWESVHIVGFSMGTQIGAKLAASVATDRVRSLTLIGAAAGGVLSLPRSLHAIRHSLRAMLARTPLARARADLRLHFTKATLHSASSCASSCSGLSAPVATPTPAEASPNPGGAGAAGAEARPLAAPSPLPFPSPAPSPSPSPSPSRPLAAAASPGGAPGAQSPSLSATPPRPPSGAGRGYASSNGGGGGASSSGGGRARRQKEDLIEEYVAHAQFNPPQPKHGFHGHLHAVWQHRLSSADKAVLSSRRFPVLFIHGIKDKVAPPAYAAKLSRELGAALALLPGAHVVMRESAQQVNALLFDMVFGEPSPAHNDITLIPVQALAALQRGGEPETAAAGAAGETAAALAAAAAAAGGGADGAGKGEEGKGAGGAAGGGGPPTSESAPILINARPALA